MRVLRADDTGELELSGTAADMRDLAQVLRSDRGSIKLDQVGDPSPYSRALGSLKSARTTGRLTVSVTGDSDVLRVVGDRDSLESLASVVEDFAAEGDLSYHLHLEHLPGHPYLSPRSEPLVVRLTAAVVEDAASGDGLGFLQRWYQMQCDGDWEHEFGVRVATLDNPGWTLEVDLVGTSLEGRGLARVRTMTGTSWMFVESDGHTFQVSCDPASLTTAFDEFRRFAEAQ